MTREIHFVFRALTYSSIFLLALAALYAILSSKPHPIEVRSTAPRILGLPASPGCDSLYNTGRHRLWASCMGVEYNTGAVDSLLYELRYDDGEAKSE